MTREEHLKILKIAATLAAGSIHDDHKSDVKRISEAFRECIEIARTEFEKLTGAPAKY